MTREKEEKNFGPVNVSGSLNKNTWGSVTGTRPVSGATGETAVEKELELNSPEAATTSSARIPEQPMVTDTGIISEVGDVRPPTGREPELMPVYEQNVSKSENTNGNDGAENIAADTKMDLDAEIEAALQAYLGYQATPFEYNADTDPLYQQYAEMYERQARAAMENTYANMAARSGGFGNSYAGVAAQQAYHTEMDALNDIIPELYQYAYSRHQSEQNAEYERLKNNYELISGEREYRDAQAYNEWYRELQERGYAEEQAAAEAETMATHYNNVLGALAEGVSTEAIVADLVGQGVSETDAQAIAERAQATWDAGYGEWWEGQQTQAEAEATVTTRREIAATATELYGTVADVATVADLLVNVYGYDEDDVAAVMGSLGSYVEQAQTDDVGTGEAANGLSAYEYVAAWMSENAIDSVEGYENRITAMLGNAGYSTEEIAAYEAMMGTVTKAQEKDAKELWAGKISRWIKTPAALTASDIGVSEEEFAELSEGERRAYVMEMLADLMLQGELDNADIVGYFADTAIEEARAIQEDTSNLDMSVRSSLEAIHALVATVRQYVDRGVLGENQAKNILKYAAEEFTNEHLRSVLEKDVEKW